MTFLEKCKRFFEPIKNDPITYIQSTFEGLLDGLYLASTLYFFEKIGYSVSTHNTETFNSLLVLYSGFTFMYLTIKMFVIHWWWVNIYVSIDNFAKEKYLTQFIQWEPNIVEKIGTWRFLQVYKSGTRLWMEVIHGFLSNDLALIVASVYGIWRISQFHIFYALGILGILIFVLIITYFIDKYHTIPYRKRRVEIETEYGRILARIFMSKMEYLQNNEFEKEKWRIHDTLEQIRIENYGIDNSVWWMYIFVRLIGFAFRMVVYVSIGKEVLYGTEHFWTFSVYILIITMLETTLRTVYDTFRRFTRDGQHIEKLWSIFDSLTPIAGYHTWSPFSPKKKPIIIKDITYGYNDTNVFEHFSLTIEPWKKTALVWESGGGKTTLMKLIAGYLHPDEGYISVLWNRLDETALKTYYPHIGYLTQEPSVFDGTIRENLLSAVSLLSHSEETPLEKKLTEALRLAHCDFVFDLEHGLDTEIGERGVRLSGWQKQRLAIAKIFLKDPEIILLDEPTSALDSFSEEQITQALDTLFRDRTVLIIAHRLQTVKKSDTIMVIEWWKIQEQWSHEDLIANWGIYHKMLELQSGF
jgi:ATP-binding cassette subfamily B protein